MTIQALSGRGNMEPQVILVNPQLEAGLIQVSWDLEKGECCDPNARGISLEQSWPTWVDGLLGRSETPKQHLKWQYYSQRGEMNGSRQNRQNPPHTHTHTREQTPCSARHGSRHLLPVISDQIKYLTSDKRTENHLLAISLFFVGKKISVRNMGISMKHSGTDHKNRRPQTSSQKGFSQETKFRPMGQKQRNHEMNRSPWSYFSFPSYLHKQCWEPQKKEEHILKMVKQHQEPRAQEELSGQLWMAGCWFFT